MKILAILSVLLFGIPAQPAQPARRVTLRILKKDIWTLEIGPKAIRGDRNVLNRDGEVIYGFIGGKPARLKLTEDRVIGRLSGTMVSLKLEQGPEHTKLSGILDRDRLFAEVSKESLQLWDHALRIELKPEASAPATLSDKRGMVKLIFEGCDASLAHTRPELLVMLHRLVLPRVMQLEDIPFHMRMGRSADESQIHRGFNPQPTPASPRRQAR